MAGNRLSREHSPYLRQHRWNPVDWYPWGEEALCRAREEDKPIFLSVGYSTCYWCSVMARESFSDESVAAFMNEHFINVLVDREERPDLDEIYMAATRLLTHHGGWPNTLVLTPEGLPWFCGTYFPPQDRGEEQPGFARVLTSMAEAWRTRRADTEEQGRELLRVMRDYLEDRGEPASEPPRAAVAERALESLARTFDPQWGGFGTGAKFPTPSNLLLLEDFAASDAAAAHMLRLTLDGLARGGICDQLGGGFHRYATDREWRVPHFEKMLGDNGWLLELLARQLERDGDPELEATVRRAVAFLSDELSLEGGGFATALGAGLESHGSVYYAWSLEEITAALGEEDTGFLAPMLGYDGAPFFEESYYVFHRPAPLEEHARRRRMRPEELRSEVAALEAKLLEARARRPRPELDDKVLADANGMAIAGLAEAGRVLGDAAAVERAARCADFLLHHLRPSGGPLHHVFRQGTAYRKAFLADYVHLVRGLLALFRATHEERWLAAARELTTEQVERLGDERGGFFVTGAAPDLICRSKEIFDGAQPSPNALAILNLLELEERAGDVRWRELAAASLKAFARMTEQVDGVRTLCLAARRFHRGARAAADS